MKNKKAFTLIELIAVLVILAILALIVTPIVMSIINKAKTSANKRSIDAYGRSIELAIASHMLDTGEIPTSISDLTIEYSGDEVVCATTQLNSDSTVYLAGCTVGGKAVDGYTYGKDNTTTYDAYSVGDEVSYNNVDYYVIEDSDSTEANVTLLKKTPLTVAEVDEYGGVGTENNHVNMYACNPSNSSCYQTAQNQNGYGGMAYYSSETCGYVNNGWVETGCTNNYADSDIKYVVDAWKNENVQEATTARLLTLDDLPKLGYELQPRNDTDSSLIYKKTDNTPSWMNCGNSYCWSMSLKEDSSAYVWSIGNAVNSIHVYGAGGNIGVVRPVIVLPKSILN